MQRPELRTKSIERREFLRLSAGAITMAAGGGALIGCGGGGGEKNNTPQILSTNITSVGPTGGSIILNNIGEVNFLQNSFLDTRQVKMSATTNPSTQNDFKVSASVFLPLAVSTYEVRVNSGHTTPLQNCNIALKIPRELINGTISGSSIQVFCQFYFDNDSEVLDNFEWIPSITNESQGVINFNLDPYLFTNKRYGSELFEAVIMLASTQGGISTRYYSNFGRAEDTCQINDFLVSSPLKGYSLSDLEDTLIPGGEFGGTRNHKGVDFSVPDGTPVISAHNGVVEKIGAQKWTDADKAAGIIPEGADVGQLKGWGNYVVIRSVLPDGRKGPATLYAHLQSVTPSLKESQTIAVGDDMGNVGHTGTVRPNNGGTGAHLHFELIKSGENYVGGMKLNPLPCIPTDSMIHHFNITPLDLRTVFTNKTIQLTAEARNAADAPVATNPNKIKWFSSNELIATVTRMGNTATITGKKPGTVGIQVLEEQSGITQFAQIEVTAETTSAEVIIK